MRWSVSGLMACRCWWGCHARPCWVPFLGARWASGWLRGPRLRSWPCRTVLASFAPTTWHQLVMLFGCGQPWCVTDLRLLGTMADDLNCCGSEYVATLFWYGRGAG